MDDLLRLTKLDGWERITPSDIKKGQHIRITSNKYKEAGRKCQHVVVQKIDEGGDIFVNSYKDKKYSDWKLNADCPYKQQRYYARVKPDIEHTGICIRCKDAKVRPPYYICIFCRNNPTPKSY